MPSISFSFCQENVICLSNLNNNNTSELCNSNKLHSKKWSMDSLNNEYYSSIVTTFPVWMNTTLQPSDLFPESAEDRQITVTIRTVTLVPSESNSTSLEGNVSRKEGSAINTPELRIALYSIIFLLSVLGNGLVVATLVQNKRMRTVTNVLLLNLAISDLLLSVFCMPFTLVGALLRDFIFGVAMCKLIPFLQGKMIFNY